MVFCIIFDNTDRFVSGVAVDDDVLYTIAVLANHCFQATFYMGFAIVNGRYYADRSHLVIDFPGTTDGSKKGSQKFLSYFSHA
jgi:hypothetical protein